jgi:predicted RNA binding protein YcfA (HicA-like mRNA interferase family)
MPRLPRISGAQAIRTLERLGFVQIRQRGSDVVLRKERPEGAIGTTVPLHRELAVGTLRGILRQAQIQPDDFIGQL